MNSGGYCSRLYTCQDISDGQLAARSKGSKIFLIRLLGGKLIEANESFVTLTTAGQAVLLYQLGELGIGPKLYGAIEGGRLEEFIPSHTLTTEDLSNVTVRDNIARKLARYHGMDKVLPVIRRPMDWIEQIEIKLKLLDKDWIVSHPLLKNSRVDLKFLVNFDFNSEIEWFRQTAPQIGGRHVFCSSDMNRLNCLIRDEPDKFGEIVTLIDYELSSFSNRGLDIGNHFNWYIIDITAKTRLSGMEYPDEQRRHEFVTTYLEEAKKENYYDKFDEYGLDSVDQVLKEAEFYGMIYAYFFVAFMLKPNKYFESEGEEALNGWMVSA